MEHAMTFSRRRLLHLALAVTALPAVPRKARAQTYPNRPVHWIVGFAPGGGNDIVARLMGKWLSERTGQQFIIENRPGAGTNIATETVANAAPDGYTLLLAGISNASNASLFGKINFNFIRDIAPVAGIERSTLVMVVNPSVPAETVSEFVAYAKRNPGKINVASAGTGSIIHLAGELFNMTAGVNMVHVPYRGSGPALTALLGGDVQVLFASAPSAIEFIKTGKLRALGVTVAMRSDALPDLPTIGESIPGYEISTWHGVGAPRSTPAAVIDRLNQEINAGLADPKMKARFADLGYVPMPLTPAEFANLIAKETDKWGKVVKFAGIKLD
jgi:tripartite-type tricarboxylate transporter receptor subunit TctC